MLVQEYISRSRVIGCTDLRCFGRGFLTQTVTDFYAGEAVPGRKGIPSEHGYAAYYISAEKHISADIFRNTPMRMQTAVWDSSDTGGIFLYLSLTDEVI